MARNGTAYTDEQILNAVNRRHSNGQRSDYSTDTGISRAYDRYCMALEGLSDSRPSWLAAGVKIMALWGWSRTAWTNEPHRGEL